MNIKLIPTLAFLLSTVITGYTQEVETLSKYRRIRLAQEHYERGISEFQKGDYSGAIDNLKSSVTLDPGNYQAYYFLGSAYERLLYHDKALLNYNISISLKPDFNEALFNRAVLYYKSGKYEKAAEEFNHLLTLPPGETQAIYFRGINYGEDDDDTGFDELMTMANKEADIYNYLAQCYNKMNRNDKAVECFTLAINLKESEDNYYVNRGLVYAEMGKTSLAKQDYEKALSINPGNSLASVNLALLERDENILLPLERINEVINRNPEVPFAYSTRAYYKFRNNEYKSAIKDYNRAIELDPDNPDYYIFRGMSYEKIHDMNSALRDYNIARKLDPGDYRVWYQLGNICYKKEDFKKSIGHYTKAIKLKPDHDISYYNRGLSYFNLDQMSKACDDMDKVKKLNPGLAESIIKKYCNKPR